MATDYEDDRYTCTEKAEQFGSQIGECVAIIQGVRRSLLDLLAESEAEVERLRGRLASAEAFIKGLPDPGPSGRRA